MSWKQILREVERANRRSKRAAALHHQQLVRERSRIERFEAKQAELNAAQAEVSEFESYLEMLVSMHKDCGDTWDWTLVLNSAAPARPKPSSLLEDRAAEQLRAYAPSFFDKLFRRTAKRIAELDQAVQYAVERDRLSNDNAEAEYRQAVVRWDASRKVATDVLQRSPDSYVSALKIAGPFGEVEDFQTRVVIEHAEADVVVLSGFLQDEELVPNEELKLTSTGKVSRKAMPAGRYWALHQDYVCSCALRVARETLAVLPINRVIVNVSARRIDSSTGHRGHTTILAVHFTRQSLQALDMDNIDPSDSLRNFNFRMKFKKTSGFEPVAPITADEQWISA